MKFIGDIDHVILAQEIAANVGAQGIPQRWYLTGAEGEVDFVRVDPTLDDSGVAAVVNAHIANAPARCLQKAERGCLDAVDAAADRCRRKYATDIAFQQRAYDEKANQATAFLALAAPRPTEATGYDWLAIRLEAMRVGNPAATATDAANDILAAKQAWVDASGAKLKQTEREREVGKARVKNAATEADKIAAKVAAVAIIDAL